MMRFPILSTFLTALALAAPAAAQKVQVIDHAGERANAIMLFFGDSVQGAISIDHGQPMWKASYDGMRDQLKGHLCRLGNNWWTTMTTSADLEMGGKTIHAGAWLLALSCDDDGKFALAFLDAKKGMKQGAMPWPQDGKFQMNWKPDFTVPLEFKANANGTPVEKMTMTVKADGGDLGKCTFALDWGPHKLTSAFAVKTGKKGSDEKEEMEEDEAHEKAGKKKDKAK